MHYGGLYDYSPRSRRSSVRALLGCSLHPSRRRRHLHFRGLRGRRRGWLRQPKLHTGLQPEPRNQLTLRQHERNLRGGTEFADFADPAAYWASTEGAGREPATGYIPEGAWNEPSQTSPTGLTTYVAAATGGGSSAYIGKPSWQIGPGVPGDNFRDVPDVSFSSSLHDGYLTCLLMPVLTVPARSQSSVALPPLRLQWPESLRYLTRGLEPRKETSTLSSTRSLQAPCRRTAPLMPFTMSRPRQAASLSVTSEPRVCATTAHLFRRTSRWTRRLCTHHRLRSRDRAGFY
jgi:hypothetical protein